MPLKSQNKTQTDVSVMGQERLAQIVEPLLAWYDLHARKLPWRETREPYRIWVSEIMLQQTRVETVIPYYERFKNRLPDIADLAEVPEEELLKLWQGLGYYSRARNLQKAAIEIMDRFEGCFPQDYESIHSLPGIGAYTAGAIASIAFGQPVPAVDGNVLRVVCRLTDDHQDINKSQVKKEITDALRQIYPQARCGDLTQSLMELGATICLPNTKAKCTQCPIVSICLAAQNDRVKELPVKSAKAPQVREQKTVFLLLSGKEVALCRRDKKGLLAGMWEFSNLDGYLSKKEVQQYLKEEGIDYERLEEFIRAKHVFTHRIWQLKSFLVFCRQKPPLFTWVDQKTMRERIALPTAFAKFEQALRDEQLY